jgi:Bacterial self-protective colicin-like immunity
MGNSVENDARFAHELGLAIAPYRQLLKDFVEGGLTADEFEKQYFEIYLNDNDLECSDTVFNVVDGFFAEVDAYVSNPAIRDLNSGDLGPDELRAKAKALLRRAGG